MHRVANSPACKGQNLVLKKQEFTYNALGFSFGLGAFRVVFQFSSQTTKCIMKPDILMYFILFWEGGALSKTLNTLRASSTFFMALCSQLPF